MAKGKVTAKPKQAIVSKKPASKRKKVSPVPKGYHSVTPYLILDGAAKAIEFYKKAFGAKVELKMEKPGGKIGHAELRIGDSKIMLSDECPESKAHSPKAYGGSPVGIHLYVNNVDQVAKRAVAAGANEKNRLKICFMAIGPAALRIAMAINGMFQLILKTFLFVN